MSQTDTPRTRRGSRPGRGRGRPRHDVETGERCDKCRQVVAVDERGRCALGHQVLDPERAAEIAADLAAGLAADLAADLADRGRGEEDTVDLAQVDAVQAEPDRDDPAARADPGRDLEIVLPDAELSRAIPAMTENAFTIPSPRLVHQMAKGGHVTAMAGEGEPAPLPVREVPARPSSVAGGAPTSSTSKVRGPAEPAIRWSADATPPAGLIRRHVEPVERRWVPGRLLAGQVLETPSYLPAAAAGRRLAQPGDHAMPVMEPLPPLPGPPAPDGPAVARSLFQQLHGPAPEGAEEAPPRAPRQEDTVPVFSRAAHVPPELEATAPDRITTELPELDPSTVVPAALDTPAERPAAVQEEWAVVLSPATPSPPTSSLTQAAGPRRVTVDDLAPDAPSALDLQDLPAGPPRVEPTYELEPVTEDTLSPRGPLQIAAGGVFLVVLVAVAWYLATTL